MLTRTMQELPQLGGEVGQNQGKDDKAAGLGDV